MQLTSQQLALLRSQPHKTDLWLSIYRPTIRMAARVTGTYSIGDTAISYYGVYTGTFAHVYNDLTVLVGTTPEGDDIGRVRLRSATSTVATMAENWIRWQNGQYLTFINYINVEAVYPKIISDPNNDENVIFYKDNDIPYTNQNSVYGTFPNAGPHRALFLDSGTGTVFYSATGSYNVAGSNLTYAWVFDGGTPTGSSSETPGNIRYHTAGHYKTRLITTAANGATDTTYRYVSVYNRPGQGTNTPILKWELDNFSGSRSEGGYSASFKVYENLGDVQANALVVIFADTWYGGTKTNLGGNYPNASSIIFVGYIIGDTIKFDYEKSSAEFSCGSVTEVMKQAEGFSVSCESKASPTTWFELQEMTVPKAIYHYLRWHSTVLKTTDFQYLNDDRLVQYFDADRGSLYDAIDSFLRDGLLGSLVADRQGKLWAEISPYGLTHPFTSIVTRFAVHKQDWVGDPSITERRNSELSLIELGGIAYYGVTSNTFSALLSNAPSNTPLYHGKGDRKEGLILLHQTHLNTIAGHYLAYHNTEFPTVSMSMAGHYSNFDIAPQEKNILVIGQNDTIAGRSIQVNPYMVESMDWKYDSLNQVFRPDVVFTQLATGTAGRTINIPIVPPDDGYNFPEFELPPLPPFNNYPPTGPSQPVPLLLWDDNQGLIYTENFDSSSPDYYTVNAGLTTAQFERINFMFICPNGAVYCGRADTESGGATRLPFIARAPSIGSAFTIIEDETTIAAKYPTVLAGETSLKGCSFDPEQPERVAYIIGGNISGPDTLFNLWYGAGSTFTKGSSDVPDIAATLGFNGLTFGDDKWVFTGPSGDFLNPAAMWRFSTVGGLETQNTFGGISEARHIRAGVTPKIFSIGSSGGDVRVSEDNGDSWNFTGHTDLSGGVGMDVDPTGFWLMGRFNDPADRGKSSDGLSAISLLPNLPFGSNYVFAYAGSGGSVTSSRWVVVSSIIRFSPDFGNTWMNKEGNITSVVPIPSLGMIFVPGITMHRAYSVI